MNIIMVILLGMVVLNLNWTVGGNIGRVCSRVGLGRRRGGTAMMAFAFMIGHDELVISC